MLGQNHSSKFSLQVHNLESNFINDLVHVQDCLNGIQEDIKTINHGVTLKKNVHHIQHIVVFFFQATTEGIICLPLSISQFSSQNFALNLFQSNQPTKI